MKNVTEVNKLNYFIQFYKNVNKGKSKKDIIINFISSVIYNIKNFRVIYFKKPSIFIFDIIDNM